MARKTPAQDDKVYTLKIRLANTRPVIWRRVEVLGSILLGDLHRVIQGVMDWEECHLHRFVFGEGKRPGRAEIMRWQQSGSNDINELWGQRIFEDPLSEPEDAEDEWGATLAEVAPEVKTHFVYEYDFGDGWEHLVEIEKIEHAVVGAEYPRCIAGKRRAPMEDSGGPWGWADKIKAVNRPDHGKDYDLRGWMGLQEGEKFDAEYFDVGETNARRVKVIKQIDRSRKAYVKKLSKRRR
jgi:hypothetical protein